MNKELLKKSIQNIRLKQIQDKVNLESELEYSRKRENPPLPREERLLYWKEKWSSILKVKRSCYGNENQNLPPSH